MGGMEGVGEAVTGGMLARSVEPVAGEAEAGAHEGACLNCGTLLIENYCHHCGQQAHVHRSLHAFFHDIAHSVLHFEGKIWRTLPLLAWKPGELTRRYIEGQRARFVSPMALFLFSVFLMFAVFSTVGGPWDMAIDPNGMRNTRAEVAAGLKAYREDLKELQEAKAEAVREGKRGDVPEIDQGITETQQAITAMEAVQRTIGEPDDIQALTGWGRLDGGIRKINENPGLALYKVQNNAYKFSWLLIPLSVPFMWLLFPFRRGTRLYDHTVFVTYSLAFMTLFMVLLSLFRLIGLGDAWIGTAFAFVPIIHIFRQLKGAYQLRWWSAAIRTMLLFIFANVAFALFVAILFFLGAMG